MHGGGASESHHPQLFPIIGPPRKPRIALALSGGGFRASIFHLGVLRRLAELGWLDCVDVISAVSGGSLLAGFLTLHWSRMIAEGGTPAAFDSVLVRPFLRIVTSQNFIRRWALQVWKCPLRKLRDGSFTRTKLAAELFSEIFYNGGMCPRLPECPYLVLNASSLLSIRAWRFTRSGLGDSRIGHAAWGDHPLSIGEAVGASAAFPPVFPPPRIRARNYRFGPPIYDEDRIATREYIPLSDGGVYDNLAVEALQKPTRLPGEREPLPTSEFLVISDAGYPAQYRFRSSGLPVLSEALLLYRVDDIAREQVCAQRRRELVSRFRDPNSPVKGALISLGTTLDRLGPALATYSAQVPRDHQIPKPLVASIKAIRTNLDRFNEVECEALMYHAYTITDAVLWTHRLGSPEAFRAPAVPCPEWRITFSDATVAEWSKGLAKSAVPPKGLDAPAAEAQTRARTDA